MATHRALCWTSYNLEVLDTLTALDFETNYVRYTVCQVEQCPESGRLHLQGYTEFSRPTRISKFKRLIADNAVHCERRRGTRSEAREYCLKSDSRQWGPYEFGEFTAGGQGGRSDLLSVKRAIDEGASQAQIASDFFESWCRHSRAFTAYRNILVASSPSLRAVRTTVLWGTTGSGKSHRAFQYAPNAYRLSPPNVDNGAIWWDGYDSQKTIILDDFESWIPFRTLLQLLDKYPVRCQVKGGVIMAAWEHVIITSNAHPDSWYANAYMGGPLERRLHAVYHLTDTDDIIVFAG